MATYVNDLRLKEIATGDESGTWGTSTNTNLELIGEALGFGTEAITTNADTHTTTVADGSTDPGRAMYLKYTGTLDSACTITIAPNTMSRMHFIENGTSGSQNIIISQGSGANVTIPAGDVKAVYLDGAGSGAAVTDAFASLNTVDLKVEDDLTVTDDVSIGGALTLTGNGDFNGDLDVDGTTNLDVVDIDGAVDMASTLQVDGSITSSAEMTLTRSDNGINLSLVSTDADANEGPGMVLYRNSSSPADSDVLGQIYFQGENDADQKVSYAYQEARIVDASDGTEDGRIETNVVLAGTAVSRILMDATETVFNDNSKDLDFRVETDGNANMIFVDGGNNLVTIGGATFESADTFCVREDGANSVNTRLVNDNADANGVHFILQKSSSSPADNDELAQISFFGQDDGGNANTFAAIQVFADDVSNASEDGIMTFSTAVAGTFTENLRIGPGGFINIGATSNAHETLHVTGPSGNAILLHMDADTADGTSALLFKNDSTNTDVRIKGGIIYQRDDPGTRGTGDLHICVNGVNSDTNVSVSDSKMGFLADGTIITTGNFYVSGETSAFTAGSHNGNLIQVNGQSLSSRAASNLQTHKTFFNSNGSVGSITTNASATAFNTSSDYRLKENVVTDWDGTTLLKQLKPSKFNFKADKDTTVQGFLAHEVSSIVPQAVAGEKDAVYTAEDAENNIGAIEGQPNYQQIDHSKLVPLLVKTIQEMEARITTLEG